LLQRDVGDRVPDEHLRRPLRAAVGGNERERGLHFPPHLRLLLVGHEPVAGLDGRRVLLDADRQVLLLVTEHPALALRHRLAPKLPRRERVAPVAEGALGELHDVALVDEGQALALEVDGVTDRGPDEALRAFPGDRLDAEGARLRDADLLDLPLVAEPGDALPDPRRTFRPPA